MIRLTLIIAVLVALCACTDREIDDALSDIKGEPNAQQIADAKAILTEAQFSSASSAYVAQHSSSVQPVESVSVALVETASSSEAYVPPPIECVQTPWHGMNFSCDGKTSWPVE